MKRICFVLATAALLVFCTFSAAAADRVVELTIGDTQGYVDGIAYTLDAPPMIRNSRTMLPVRFLGEALGATVDWDGATATATLRGEGVQIAITIGAATAKINGAEVALDSPAFIENSRTYLPVRVIADALGAAVDWNGETSTATLTKVVPDPVPEYYTLTKEAYQDKATAAYLSKLIAFTTDYKFVWNKDKTPRVALPDDWFGWCAGSDTPNNPYHQKVAKLLVNAETGKKELWIADTFGIEILNQYILKDMYEQFGTVTTKVITDDWVKYDVWDMGGGNRTFGAYALAKKYAYISPYLGRLENGNHYAWCEEPWIECNTIGLLYPGMPTTCQKIEKIFGATLGDGDGLAWVDFISAIYSLAYVEEDIPTLIREAAKVFPENSWYAYVVDHSFELYQKYPTNWRRAIVDAEQDCRRNNYFYNHKLVDNMQSQVDVNMAFSLLALLYGNVDYEATERIFSLSGYDARGVIFLPLLGIREGMRAIPQEALDAIWQDGEGVIVNLAVPETLDQSGLWMFHGNLPERQKIADIMEMFRENFEKTLLAVGGKIEGDTYYIPREPYRVYDYKTVENYSFETGDLTGFTAFGKVENVTVADESYMGDCAVKVVSDALASTGVYTTVHHLKVGETYRVVAFAETSVRATAELFAREVGATAYQHASVSAQSEYARREFTFTATAPVMEIGVLLAATDTYGYCYLDELFIYRVREKAVGKVTLPGAAGTAYTGKVELALDGRQTEEVYLKLVFANANDSVVPMAVTVNGISFNVTPLYRTGRVSTDGACDAAYVPIVLSQESNTVTLDFGSGTVSLLSASLVAVEEFLAVK